MLFCTHCGYKLPDGAEICHLCGCSETEDLSYSQSQRNQKNIEEVFQCGACNAFLPESTTPCPYCGVNITCWITNSPTYRFMKDIREIEKEQWKPKSQYSGIQTPDPLEIEKLVLVRSFPIPVRADEIEKFIILATEKIDTKLSMQPILDYDIYELLNADDVELTLKKAISDEWLAKMKLAYKNAQRLYSNEEIFPQIQKAYFAKLKELKLTKTFK